MKELNLKNKVRIIPSRKSDGSFNYGVVIGKEFVSTKSYLCFADDKQFFKAFDGIRYKVAYIDKVSKRGISEWFNAGELEKVSSIRNQMK